MMIAMPTGGGARPPDVTVDEISLQGASAEVGLIARRMILRLCSDVVGGANLYLFTQKSLNSDDVFAFVPPSALDDTWRHFFDQGISASILEDGQVTKNPFTRLSCAAVCCLAGH